MFRAVSLPIIRNFPLYIQHWHMLYRSDNWAELRSILILHASGRQTCITCASAELTVANC
jgi:hypothetical protein